MARPVGSYGAVALALRNAAQECHGTVRELAARSQVGYAVARYTVPRLLSSGYLVVVDDCRPAVIGPPQSSMARQSAADAATELQRYFFETINSIDGGRMS